MNISYIAAEEQCVAICSSEGLSPIVDDNSDEDISSTSEWPLLQRVNNQQCPHSVFAMDGPSSKFSSVPAASVTNSDLGTPFSHASHNAFIDPPRPAKEGYEWVWFPAGYWAEREVAEAPSKDTNRAFRWRKRSGKSSSESAKNSPQIMQTPLSGSALSEKTEESPGQAMVRHCGYPTNTSSESGVSPFTSNRMSDAPPPSPYLSEEAHVQSLQRPPLETITSKNSWSGGSTLKQRSALSPSPLHHSSSEVETSSDWPGLSTGRQTPTNAGLNVKDLGELGTEPPSGNVKEKKSFIQWRMLSEQRQKPRKLGSSISDECIVVMKPERALRPINPAASSARKESCKSEEGRKSLKTKFFSRSRWRRKISNSSKVSTSSSLQNSTQSQSPCQTPLSEKEEEFVDVWASEFPGNEARRVLIPHAMGDSMDRFPRSFFSDLPASTAHHHPLPRQEGQSNHKKSHLSTSFVTVDSSSSTTPRPRTTGSGGERSSIMNNNQNNADGRPASIKGVNPERPTRSATRKEWWEVPAPAPRSHNSAEQRQTHAAMAADKQRAFEFDLPEHLPTSPMCPANKRHKSGGTGVCVYHGRAKRRQATPHTSSEDTTIGGNTRDDTEKRGSDSQEDSSETESDVWK